MRSRATGPRLLAGLRYLRRHGVAATIHCLSRRQSRVLSDSSEQSTLGRKETLLSMFRPEGRGLEIGPSFNPLFAKADGYNVEILDHLSADDLRRKYAGNPGLERIEEVDYVWTGQPLSELVGTTGRYDYIVASHVIEHTPDLLGFLLECEKLLSARGVLVLIVPDKRFSFDVLRPCATSGAVLQAHWERRQRHAPGKIFDEVAYNVLRARQLAWPRGASGELAFFSSLEEAKALFERCCDNNEFHDIHAWQFTPSRFRLMVKELHLCRFMQLNECAFREGEAPEFYITLSRTGAGCPIDRLQLLEAAIRDERDIAIS